MASASINRSMSASVMWRRSSRRWAVIPSAPASADSGASGNEARPPESVAGIAEAALPSVVTIETGSRNGEGSTGTGFVYDEQGRIMTNNHVVAGGGTVFFAAAFVLGALDKDLLAQLRRRRPAQPVDLSE